MSAWNVYSQGFSPGKVPDAKMKLQNKKYKWCHRCSGSIDKSAIYCYFCRNELLVGEQKKDAFFGPQSRFDTARRWVPNLNGLIQLLPDSDFKEHFQSGLKTTGRLPSMVNYERDDETERQINESNVGLERAPMEQERAIIRDLFLHLIDDGQSVTQLVDTPKLRVLKISAESLEQLYELRAQNIVEGKLCKFCCEYSCAEAQNCEFCKSNFVEAPKREARRFRKNTIGIFPLDKALLKDVLIHVAVSRALTGGGWRTELADVLSKHDVCNADVEEALRQRRYMMTEDMQIELPMSEWQKSLMFEGLDDGMDGFHSIHNIIELGQVCVHEELLEEAELVLNFAMSVADTCRLGNVQGLEIMRETLKTSGWMALSQLYETTGRYAEAESAHKNMFNMLIPMPIPGLDEVMKAAMEMISPQRSIRQADLCVKQKKFDEAIELYKKALSALDTQENKPFVGFSKMAGLISGESPSKISEPRPEDFDVPMKMGKDEASKLANVGELINVSTAQRVGIMQKLAEVYMMIEQLPAARFVLDEAMQLGEQLNDPYQALNADVFVVYGRLCLMMGEPADAEPKLQEAIELYMSVKDPMDPEAYEHVVNQARNVYADCLDKLGKSDEAKKFRN